MSTHLIEKQVFQFGLEREELLQPLSRELNVLMQGELLSAIDEILSAAGPKEAVIRVSQLELNLGEIAFSEFSTVFSARFQEKLRELFLRPEPQKALKFIQIEGADRSLELLRVFFSTGQNPWWASKNERDYDAMMRGLFAPRRQSTRELVFDTAIFPSPRKRIIYNLQEETLYRLFDILSPDPEQFFRQYVEDLIRVNRYRRIANEEERKVKYVIQELILLYLVVNKDTSLDQLSFLRYQLMQFARHYRIAYPGLLRYIRKALKHFDLWNKQNGIAPLIEKLLAETNISGTLQPFVAESGVLDSLRSFLLDGYFTGKHVVGSHSQVFNLLFSHALQHQPEALRKLIFETGKTSRVRRRLIYLLSDEAVKRMFRLLAPSLLESIYAYFQLTEQVMVHTPAINQEKIAYRKTVQELTLKVIVEQLRGETDNQVFLRAQLNEYALRYGIALPVLLALLLADLGAIKTASQSLIKLEKALKLIYQSIVGDVFQPSATDNGIDPEKVEIPKIRRAQSLRIDRMESLLRQWLKILTRAGIVSVADFSTSMEGTAGTPQQWLSQLLAKWAGSSREKQRFLARALFIQGFVAMGGRQSGLSIQVSTVLELLQSEGFSGSPGLPGKKAFESVLAFLESYPRVLSARFAEGFFRRIGFPRAFEPRWIMPLAKAIDYKHPDWIGQWIRLLEDIQGMSSDLKERVYRFMALRMVQEKGSRPQTQALILESTRFLASAMSQPLESVVQQLLKKTPASVSPRWRAQLIVESRRKIPVMRRPVPRITLAELLQLLGSDIQGLSEEELEVLLVQEWLSRPTELLSRLRNLRHHPALIELLLENISIPESEILIKELLGLQYAEWQVQITALEKVYRELGIFRQLPDDFSREVFAVSMDFFLTEEPVWSDLQEYYHFLIERWQLAGQLDYKTILRVLAEEEKALSIPTPLRLALQEVGGFRNLQPLHVSALSRQRQEDLLLFWLRHGQSPEWAENDEITSLKVLQRLEVAEPEFASRLVQAALEGRNEEQLAEWLGDAGRTRFLRLLQPVGAGIDLVWWYENLMPVVGVLKPQWTTKELPSKWFVLLLRARAWAFRQPEEMGQWLQNEFGIALVELLSKEKRRELAEVFQKSLPAFPPQPQRVYDEVNKWLHDIQQLLLHGTTVFQGEARDWNQLPSIVNQLSESRQREFWQSLRLMLETSDALKRFASLFAPDIRMQWMKQRVAGMELSSEMLVQMNKLNLSLEMWDAFWPLAMEVLFLKPSGDKVVAGRLLEAFLRVSPQQGFELFRILEKQRNTSKGATLGRMLLLLLPTTEAEKVKLRDRETVLQYYLQFGTLPQAYIGWSLFQLRQAFLELLSIGRYSARRMLFQAWKLRPSRNFLLQMLQPGDLANVAVWIHPALPMLLEKLNSVLQKAGNPSLEEALRWQNPMQMAEFLLNLWTRDRSVFADPDVVVKSVFSAYSAAVRLLPRLLVHQVNNSAAPKTEKEKAMWKRLEEMVVREEERVGEQQREVVEEVLEAGESIHLYNAGLCLIWPFLGRLFRLLDMVEGNDFKDEEFRMRAVQLSQFIVTGLEETPEAELSLNKVLCGMDLSIPVEPSFQITEPEKNMIDSMLRGVLHNWEKMQGTSVPTFRDTFLKREGRLSLREGMWELVVEKKAYDVLLTTLPWQIRTIKLAWMPIPLQVAWV